MTKLIKLSQTSIYADKKTNIILKRKNNFIHIYKYVLFFHYNIEN